MCRRRCQGGQTAVLLAAKMFLEQFVNGRVKVPEATSNRRGDSLLD
jgi:hypothetical protein